MNDINNNYEDDIDYDMDYEENTEDDMNYENDISHGYKCETIVAVKKFRNATQINSEFLNEINITLKMNNSINDVSTIKIYGVARDLQNGEYAIVTDFKDGDESNESIELSEDDLSEDFILEVEEAFSQEREDKWKLRLAELATNPIPLKKSQNLLTSKRLNFSESLSLKLSVEDWNKLRLTD
ncbi:21710_t:CDS:2 [Rhizophagus irregularis]|nr:21710_t:CDS:2 [Rhizophagus irregularis]